MDSKKRILLIVERAVRQREQQCWSCRIVEVVPSRWLLSVGGGAALWYCLLVVALRCVVVVSWWPLSGCCGVCGATGVAHSAWQRWGGSRLGGGQSLPFDYYLFSCFSLFSSTLFSLYCCVAFSSAYVAQVYGTGTVSLYSFLSTLPHRCFSMLLSVISVTVGVETSVLSTVVSVTVWLPCSPRRDRVWPRCALVCDFVSAFM